MQALRQQVLMLGKQYGWRTHEVKAFAESLTGRPWEECGVKELGAVRDEYYAIQRAIGAKLRRRLALADALIARDRPGEHR